METTPLPAKPGDGSVPRQVAIVGLNRDTASLLPSLLEAEGVQVVKILNPDFEDLSRLTLYPHLDMIIDTTGSAATEARIRKLPLKKVDVISGVGARILFCSVRGGSAPREGIRENVLHCMEEVRETVSRTRNREEILKAILGTAVKSSGADCGSLMLLDATRRHLTIEAAVGLDEQVVLATAQRVGKGISGTAIRTGEPILIQGAADRLAYRTDYSKPELVSSICCPLIHAGETVGVINISSRTPARVFTGDDVSFLSELAGLTAEVIRTVKDGDPGQQGAQAGGLFNSVREILAMKFRFEERLNLLLMKMANAFGADLCSYYEYSAEDGFFVAKASSESVTGQLQEKPKFLDEFFAQRVLKTDNTLCVNAAGKTPRGKKWYMIQPIRSGQELIGALFVYLQSEKNALKEETVVLRKIGELLAAEVTRNRRMETVKVRSLKTSAIKQFSQDLAGAPTLSEAARMILANIRNILEAETCVLRLRNAQDEELGIFDTLSHKNPAWLKDILAMDERIIADLSPGRNVALFEDLRESPYNVDLLGSETALVAALEMDGEVLGSLSLYDKVDKEDRKSLEISATRSFTEIDRELVLAFAQETARGLERFFPFPSPASWRPAPVPLPSE